MLNGSKRGLSAVVGMVLLIAIMMTMAGIIFAWSGDFISRLSPPVDCSQISFEAEILKENEDYILSLVNNGDIAIKGFQIKSEYLGDKKVEEEIDYELNPGESAIIDLSSINSGNEAYNFVIVPKVGVKDSDGEENIETCSDDGSYESRFVETSEVINID